MTTAPEYPYASGDLLHDRNTYFYTAFRGKKFILSWMAQRNAVIEKASGCSPCQIPFESQTGKLIEKIHSSLTHETSSADKTNALSLLNRLVQRFEVTKRIHDSYRSNWRAEDPTAFHSVPSYIGFAETLAMAHKETGDLSYLNALLKCTDTLTSLSESMSIGLRARLSTILSKEQAFVAALSDRVPLRDEVDQKVVSEPTGAVSISQYSGGSVLDDVVMIACASSRSQAYIQVLVENGMHPKQVIFLGEETSDASQVDAGRACWNGMTLPRLTESVVETCRTAGIPVSFTPDRDVNSDAAAELICASRARYAIYSGVGGQIVSERILGIGPRFLHMHSGWVPEYRGSTTLYYALLNGDTLGVTAIFLDSGIDTGPIIKRCAYPAPPKWMDVDLTYDSAIRADLLCKVLTQYKETGQIEISETQTAIDGRTYYVIHPVLKHISLLSLGKE